STEDAAEFLTQQFRQIGAINIRIEYKDKEKKKPERVFVANMRDMSTIASWLYPNTHEDSLTVLDEALSKSAPQDSLNNCIISPISGEYVNVPAGVDPKTCSFLLTSIRIGTYT